MSFTFTNCGGFVYGERTNPGSDGMLLAVSTALDASSFDPSGDAAGGAACSDAMHAHNTRTGMERRTDIMEKGEVGAETMRKEQEEVMGRLTE
jgi:hypothetical protein